MDVRASAVDGLEVVEDELVFKLYGHVRREYNPVFWDKRKVDCYVFDKMPKRECVCVFKWE